MGYDDRYGQDEWRRERGQEDRGQDRDPGARTDYYRGGDRGQRRLGPEGGFEERGDYRRSDRHAEQGQAYRDDRDDQEQRWSDRGPGGARSSFSGSGGVSQSGASYGGVGGHDFTDQNYAGGGAGPGVDPSFSGGPRFDRLDVGSIGTHGAHPVASPYGTAQQSLPGGGMGGGSSARAQAILDQAERQGRGQQQQGARHAHDPHYSDWRRQQIESFDRDYDEYRQENAARFEQEFGSWREKRGQQRGAMGRVAEHMEVVGADDAHVGTVDKVTNGRIILTKSDPDAGGHHHSIPCGWLESVDDKVRLNRKADEAKQAWRDEETSRALFEGRDSGSDGPHILERSFSGTYRDEK